MRDPNYGSEDMYGYDGYNEPTVPYVPYADQQNTTGTQPTQPEQSTESLAASQMKQDATMPAVPPFLSESYTYPYGTQPTLPAMGQEQPAPVIEAAPALPRRRSRRVLWITLASVFVLLVIVAGSSFALVSYLNRSTPVKTLDFFCNALQKEDYQSAYNQFTKQLQSQFTEGDFAGLLTQNKVVSCTHGTAGETGSRVTTSLKLLHADQGVNNDLVIMAKGTDSIWRIDDLQRASGASVNYVGF